MIKVRDLEYLDAIAKYCHFGKAADACFVSQPTLSGQIMKLEQQLGLTLIERQTRKVMLTAVGEQLILQARNVLKAVSSFEDSAKTLLDPFAGDLHVGLIPTLAPYLLPHIISDLNKALPKINFYLYENKTNNLLKMLADGTLDILILPWLESMDKFEHFDLFAEPFVFACSGEHKLSQQKQLSLADLDEQTILTLEDGHCLRDQAMGYCFSAGAKEDQSFRATSLETLRYMVASNTGVTLLPHLATLNVGDNNNIQYIEFTSPVPTRKISLVVRSGYSRMECVRQVVSTIRTSLDGTV